MSGDARLGGVATDFTFVHLLSGKWLTEGRVADVRPGQNY
jgi:hypothetical protein